MSATVPLFGPRTEPCAVLVADCPWQPRDQLPGERGAAAKYQTMSVEELCALEVHLPPRAERHVLLFWRLASMVPEALSVLDAWGYVPSAELVWCKRRPCRTCCARGRVELFSIGGARVVAPAVGAVVASCVRPCPDCGGTGGTPYLGMGSYTRGAHELCVIARPRRGRAPDRLDLGIASTFDAPLLLDVDGLIASSCACGHDKDEHPAGGIGPCMGTRDGEPCACPRYAARRGQLVHSAKPDEFYRLVERLYPGPRTEIFSRRSRPGWQVATSDQPDRLDEVARVMREVWPLREREARLAAARRRRS
jgi:N6-adenosine-specific RNA methylase IME4